MALGVKAHKGSLGNCTAQDSPQSFAAIDRCKTSAALQTFAAVDRCETFAALQVFAFRSSAASGL